MSKVTAMIKSMQRPKRGRGRYVNVATSRVLVNKILKLIVRILASMQIGWLINSRLCYPGTLVCNPAKSQIKLSNENV